MNYNQKLHALLNASALCECVIPVFVCDTSLRVCMISQGARSGFKSIHIGKNLAVYFDADTLNTISAMKDGVTLAKFTRGATYSSAIVTDGVIEDERYFIIIVEPQIIFCNTPTPWYVNEAFESIRSSAHELIASPKSGAKRLEWYCAMLARLCSFIKDTDDEAAHIQTHSSDIYSELDIIMEESAKVLGRIGGKAEYQKGIEVPFTTSTQPKHVYLITTTLLTALVLISTDGVVKLNCRTSDTSNGHMEIAFTISPSDVINTPPRSIDDLLGCVPPLRLELAALKDIASHLKLALDAYSGDEGLTVSLCIPADTTGTIKFRHSQIVGREKVHERFMALCDHIIGAML